MTFDLSHLQMPIFEGINDQPVQPTAEKASNGSYLVAQFNQLLIDVASYLNDLQQLADMSYPGWIIIPTNFSSYNSNPGDKIVAAGVGQDMQLIINLPFNPAGGTTISVIKTDPADSVQIKGTGKLHGDFYPAKVLLAQNFKLVTFIYSGERMGWITSNRDLITVEFSSGS